jgi:hypothetical protein
MLRTLVERASFRIEAIFAVTQVILPMWHLYCRNGEEVVLATPDPADQSEKRSILETMRKLFEDRDVVRYVYVVEAWSINMTDESSTQHWVDEYGNLENFPGRQEEVHFVADDETESQIIASRPILRKGNDAYLGPLLFANPQQAGGDDRMMRGLLPRKGRLH